MRFAKSSIVDGHFNGLILKKNPRKGPQTRLTRHKEHYQVTRAYTDRFRNHAEAIKHRQNESLRDIYGYHSVVTYSFVVYINCTGLSQ